MRADRGELDAAETKVFFKRYGVQLKLSTAYSLEANDKIEMGHPVIIQALVKACKRKTNIWPRLLPFTLWADRTTHSTITGYMHVELMHGQKLMMPGDENVLTWMLLLWKDEICRERLLEVRIQQLGRLPKDLAIAQEN